MVLDDAAASLLVVVKAAVGRGTVPMSVTVAIAVSNRMAGLFLTLAIVVAF